VLVLLAAALTLAAPGNEPARAAEAATGIYLLGSKTAMAGFVRRRRGRPARRFQGTRVRGRADADLYLHGQQDTDQHVCVLDARVQRQEPPGGQCGAAERRCPPWVAAA